MCFIDVLKKPAYEVNEKNMFRKSTEQPYEVRDTTMTVELTAWLENGNGVVIIMVVERIEG